jgi:hypothetical protein
MSTSDLEERCFSCLKLPDYFLALECAHHLCLNCAKSKTLRDFKDRTAGILVCDICSFGTEILENVVKTLRELYPYVSNSRTDQISSSSSDSHSATDSKITGSDQANKKVNHSSKLIYSGHSIENALLYPMKSRSTILANVHGRPPWDKTQDSTSLTKISQKIPTKLSNNSNIPKSLFDFEVTSNQWSADDLVKATLGIIDFTTSIAASADRKPSIFSTSKDSKKKSSL